MIVILDYALRAVNKDSKLVMLEPSTFPEKKLEELNVIIADDNNLQKEFDAFVEKHKTPLSAFLPYGNHYLKAL